MALVDLAFGESSVVVPEQVLRQLCLDLDFNETKLHELLRVAIQDYASTQDHQHFRRLEQWLHDNYLALRKHLPADVKQLYLSNLAFPVK